MQSTTHMHGVPGQRSRVPQPQQEQGLSRIVVGTDFSPRAERALARVAHLRLSPGAQVYLLHVLASHPERDPLVSCEHAAVEQDLKALARDLGRRLRHRRVEVYPVLRSGEPVAQVEALVEHSRAELVVMGRPHAPAAIWGHEAAFRPERLLRHIHAALLMVAPQEVRPYRHPLVAVDLSPLSQRALELTLRVCPRARRVDVLHVYDTSYALVLHQAGASPSRLLRYQEDTRVEAQAALERFLSSIQGALPRVVPTVLSGSREECILATKSRQQADLIALGARSVGLAEALLGTLAGRVLREAVCDVLIAR
jgi:nucleotide-binding universal stress UspA family protein